VVAIGTGFLLKHTLFRGTVSHFVMELPPYHAPRVRYVLAQAGQRLWTFLRRAGLTIIIIVTLLAFMNSIGTDGTMGHEGQSDSVLATVGKAITPAFEPMGIEEENWPATVGLFTGIFAKEVIVGTLSSLYGQADMEGKTGGFDLGGGVMDALRSIPEGLSGIFGGLRDPLGAGIVSGDAESVAEDVGTGSGVFAQMRSQFSRPGAYAYLLFILLYIPCVAATAAAIREMGPGLGWTLVGYTLLIAWSIATLFYQFVTGPAALPVAIAFGLLLLTAVILWVLGRTAYKPQKLEGTPA
jgi:ferrous iron transport protein B